MDAATIRDKNTRMAVKTRRTMTLASTKLKPLTFL
jgi:hypothetical protein